MDLDKYPLSMGRMLKVDPATESFVDDAEAKRMESREYRGEFVVPDVDKV